MTRSADIPYDAPAVERGVGFFETVLLSGRRACLWEPHLARLYGTLRRFALPEPRIARHHHKGGSHSTVLLASRR